MANETGRRLSSMTRLHRLLIFLNPPLDVTSVAGNEAEPARPEELVAVLLALVGGDGFGTDGDAAAETVGGEIVVAFGTGKEEGEKEEGRRKEGKRGKLASILLRRHYASPLFEREREGEEETRGTREEAKRTIRSPHPRKGSSPPFRRGPSTSQQQHSRRQASGG
jgi:hypothetical protein